MAEPAPSRPPLTADRARSTFTADRTRSAPAQPPPHDDARTVGWITLTVTLPLDAVGLYLYARSSADSLLGMFAFGFNLILTAKAVLYAWEAHLGKREWGQAIGVACQVPVIMVAFWLVSLILIL